MPKTKTKDGSTNHAQKKGFSEMLSYNVHRQGLVASVMFAIRNTAVLKLCTRSKVNCNEFDKRIAMN